MDSAAEVIAQAEQLMGLYLEQDRYDEASDDMHCGRQSRYEAYESGRSGRILKRVSSDFFREQAAGPRGRKLTQLRRTKWVHDDPANRLGGLCGEHMRHALRADLQLDLAGRRGLDVGTLQRKDICGIATLTAAATWALELSSLLLTARAHGWVKRDVSRAVVDRAKTWDPRLSWPVDTRLFETTVRAGVKPPLPNMNLPVGNRSDAKSSQRAFAEYLRRFAKDPQPDEVRQLLRRLAGLPPLAAP